MSGRVLRWLPALLALTLVLWFANLGGRALVKPDEGRYAEISREMALSGDWVTPRLNGIKYFEKPPLAYWAGAVSFAVFGAQEWSARLWSALSGLLGCVVLGTTAARLFGPGSGWRAALVLGSGLMYVIVGHSDTLDMGLAFWLTCALCAFLRSRQALDQALPWRGWMRAAWAACALAVLSKGLVGVVLPAGALVLYCLLERDLRVLRHLCLVSGPALLLLLAAPWFLLVSQRNPEFAWFFFVHEHWLRFTSGIHNRSEPWYYFFPLLVAGALPWSLALISSAALAWREEGARRDFRPQRFALAWAAFTLGFFSLSGSKLPPYILPIFPALALVAGTQLSGPHSVRAWHALPGIVAGLGALIALALVTRSGDTPVALINAFRPWAAGTALALLLGSLLGAWLARRGRAPAAMACLALTGLISGQLLLASHDILSPSLSAARIAATVRPHLRSGTPFYSIGMYDQTLDFYLGRTVTLVEFRDELDYGLLQEPQLTLPSRARFEALWRAGGYALAVTTPEIFGALDAAGLPNVVIARDHKRVFLRTP